MYSSISRLTNIKKRISLIFDVVMVSQFKLLVTKVYGVCGKLGSRFMRVGINLQLSQKIDFAKEILRKCRI